MKKLRILVNGLLCLLFFFGGSPLVHAVKALPPGMVIGDSDGLYANSEGEYYIDLENVLPGEVYEKEITIRSLDLEEPFSLGMLAEEVESSGSVDWKNHITLTLVLDGEEVYHGPLLGDSSRDWTKTPLELGVCKYGTDKILKATFKIDSALTNEDLREQSNLDFYWTFVGTRDQPKEPTKPTDSTEPPAPSDSSPGSSDSSGTRQGGLPDAGGATPTSVSGAGKRLPQTGEELVYMFLSGMLLILIALFLWKKRREEEQG